MSESIVALTDPPPMMVRVPNSRCANPIPAQMSPNAINQISVTRFIPIPY
jgi:hypothetical protein